MKYKNPWMPMAILGLLALIWGSSFILMKRGLVAFNPIEVAALRLSLGGLALLPITLKHIGKEPLKKWPFFFIVGFLGNGIPAFLFTFAQMHLNSSVSGVLNSLTPLFTMLIGVWFFKNQIRSIQVFGTVISLLGALSLVLLKQGGGISSDFRYGLMVMLAPIFYAISVNTIKNYLPDTKPMVTAALPIFAVMLPCLGVLIYIDFFGKMAHADAESWKALGYIAILGLIGTAASLVLFNRLILATSALFASSVTYLIPLIAMLWGWLDNEPIGLLQISGMSAILVGIYLVNKKATSSKEDETSTNETSTKA